MISTELFFLSANFMSILCMVVNFLGWVMYLKPWIFTEIKEQRLWDITSAERLNILKDYVHFGLEHWGSDRKGMSLHMKSTQATDYVDKTCSSQVQA